LRRFNLRRVFLERIPDAKRGIGVLDNFSYFPGQQLIFLPYPLLRLDNLTDKMKDQYEDYVNGTDILSPLPKSNRINRNERQNCLCLCRTSTLSLYMVTVVTLPNHTSSTYRIHIH